MPEPQPVVPTVPAQPVAPIIGGTDDTGGQTGGMPPMPQP
jgi:hypothetical protein